MSSRTVTSKLNIYPVDEILNAGGVDAFLKKKRINTTRRRISGTLTISVDETKRLLEQLRGVLAELCQRG
jgi:hypothetical protein